MTNDEFLSRCRYLWHVGPEGAWDSIKQNGLRTAEQLIRSADLDEAERVRLLTKPRRTLENLTVNGAQVVLRDQQPLMKRRDLGSLMGDDLSVTDWIRILNTRVYLFRDRASMTALLTKYIERDGAQEVMTLSPRRLLDVCGSRVYLAAQNTGAVARVRGPQKFRNTFLPIQAFPAERRLAEVTVMDGISDLSVVTQVERHVLGGRTIQLPL